MLLTWGCGKDSRLGQGDKDDRLKPTIVETLRGVRLSCLALGQNHGGAVVEGNGSMYLWGAALFGQLGDSSLVEATVPRMLSLPGRRVSAISCGPSHTAAVADDGSVWTWGWNRDGQLGYKFPGYTEVGSEDCDEPCVPRCVDGLGHDKASAVSCGQSCTAVLTSSGGVVVLGKLAGAAVSAARSRGGDGGGGGNGSDNSGGGGGCCRSLISDPKLDSGVVVHRLALPLCASSIACAGHHMLVLLEDQILWAVGANSSGQLGVGDTRDREQPCAVASLVAVTSASCGDDHSAAIAIASHTSSRLSSSRHSSVDSAATAAATATATTFAAAAAAAANAAVSADQQSNDGDGNGHNDNNSRRFGDRSRDGGSGGGGSGGDDGSDGGGRGDGSGDDSGDDSNGGGGRGGSGWDHCGRMGSAGSGGLGYRPDSADPVTRGAWTIWCWGRHTHGSNRRGRTLPHALSPSLSVLPSRRAFAVACGAHHCVCLLESGNLVEWQVHIADGIPSFVTHEPPQDGAFGALACGSFSSAALLHRRGESENQESCMEDGLTTALLPSARKVPVTSSAPFLAWQPQDKNTQSSIHVIKGACHSTAIPDLCPHPFERFSSSSSQTSPTRLLSTKATSSPPRASTASKKLQKGMELLISMHDVTSSHFEAQLETAPRPAIAPRVTPVTHPNSNISAGSCAHAYEDFSFVAAAREIRTQHSLLGRSPDIGGCGVRQSPRFAAASEKLLLPCGAEQPQTPTKMRTANSGTPPRTQTGTGYLASADATYPSPKRYTEAVRESLIPKPRSPSKSPCKVGSTSRSARGDADSTGSPPVPSDSIVHAQQEANRRGTGGVSDRNTCAVRYAVGDEALDGNDGGGGGCSESCRAGAGTDSSAGCDGGARASARAICMRSGPAALNLSSGRAGNSLAGQSRDLAPTQREGKDGLKEGGCASARGSPRISSTVIGGASARGERRRDGTGVGTDVCSSRCGGCAPAAAAAAAGGDSRIPLPTSLHRRPKRQQFHTSAPAANGSNDKCFTGRGDGARDDGGVHGGGAAAVAAVAAVAAAGAGDGSGSGGGNGNDGSGSGVVGIVSGSSQGESHSSQRSSSCGNCTNRSGVDKSKREAAIDAEQSDRKQADASRLARELARLSSELERAHLQVAAERAEARRAREEEEERLRRARAEGFAEGVRRRAEEARASERRAGMGGSDETSVHMTNSGRDKGSREVGAVERKDGTFGARDEVEGVAVTRAQRHRMHASASWSASPSSSIPSPMHNKHTIRAGGDKLALQTPQRALLCAMADLRPAQEIVQASPHQLEQSARQGGSHFAPKSAVFARRSPGPSQTAETNIRAKALRRVLSVERWRRRAHVLLHAFATWRTITKWAVFDAHKVTQQTEQIGADVEVEKNGQRGKLFLAGHMNRQTKGTLARPMFGGAEASGVGCCSGGNAASSCRRKGRSARAVSLSSLSYKSPSSWIRPPSRRLSEAMALYSKAFELGRTRAALLHAKLDAHLGARVTKWAVGAMGGAFSAWRTAIRDAGFVRGAIAVHRRGTQVAGSNGRPAVHEGGGNSASTRRHEYINSARVPRVGNSQNSARSVGTPRQYHFNYSGSHRASALKSPRQAGSPTCSQRRVAFQEGV